MNTLNKLKLSILLALNDDDSNDKIIQKLSEEYGDEIIYNECKWLKDNNYITNRITFHLTLDKHLYLTRIGSNIPVLTKKGLNEINSLHP